MRVSLFVRLLLALSGCAALSIGVALVLQDRSLAEDLRGAAVERVENSSRTLRSLLSSHLSAMHARYESISGTPQFRATLEIDHAPTLDHYANEMLEREGAARLLFCDPEGRGVAGAGDEGLDADSIAVKSGYFGHRGALYAATAVTLRTGDTPKGCLVAVEGVAPETLARWTEICQSEVLLTAPASSRDSISRLVEEYPGIEVHLRSSVAPERRAQANARRNLIVAGLVALVIALTASYLLSRSFSRPIISILEATEKIGEGERTVRVNVGRSDEIGDLAHSVSTMAERLDAQARANEIAHRELTEANEELGVEKERAEMASRAKSDFLANMSHELRTPLNAVTGLISLVLRGEIEMQQRQYLLTARSSAQNLVRLIGEILDHAKIESGKLQIESRPYDPRRIVEATVEKFRAEANDRGLSLEVRFEGEVPRRVEGDPHRVRQVLTQLLSNAVKFTESGSIHVRLSRRTGAAGDELLHEVSDTGVGIADAVREKIFRPFEQGDGSATRRFGGTGLGLSISRRLVSLWGGDLGFESEVDEGSRFWFTVPCVMSSGPESPDRPLPETPLVERPVLVHSPSPRIREIVQHQLESWGIRVGLASELDQAIAAIEVSRRSSRPFCCVISDADLRVGDGWILDGLEAEHSPPIIALTTLGAQESELPPADAYLPKPVAPSELFETVLRFVRPEESGPEGERLETGSLESTPSPGVRILLVEDNEMNQLVAGEVLSMGGHDYEIADNGRVALEKLRAERFDLVLMDCQMPRMSGFEATQAIRAAEADGEVFRAGGGRIPIIALTANALGGDRERCLQCGMDDYLTKPLDPSVLLRAISRQLGAPTPPAPSESPNEETGPRRAAFSLEDLLHRCMGNRELLLRILEKFRSTAESDFEEIVAARQRGENGEALQMVHRLKGVAGNVGAHGFRRSLEVLESALRDAHDSDASQRVSEARTLLAECVECAGRILEEGVESDVFSSSTG